MPRGSLGRQAKEPEWSSTFRKRAVLEENLLGSATSARTHGQPRWRFTLACDELDLRIREHEFLVIVGPSGAARQRFGGRAAWCRLLGVRSSCAARRSPAQVRNARSFFQQASLFPWRTVLANVLFGPQVQGHADRTTKRKRQRPAHHDRWARRGQYPHEPLRWHAAAGQLRPGAGDRPRCCCSTTVRRTGRARPGRCSRMSWLRNLAGGHPQRQEDRAVVTHD